MLKKNTLPLYGESCKPDMIVCWRVGSTPVLGFFLDSPERHKTNFPEGEAHKTMLNTQREFAP